MIETNISFSSSKSSNSINMNEAQQTNLRRRRHHQLQYPKQYPPIHYPSTIYITQYKNHNKKIVDDNKNSHIYYQTLTIEYTCIPNIYPNSNP